MSEIGTNVHSVINQENFLVDCLKEIIISLFQKKGSELRKAISQGNRENLNCFIKDTVRISAIKFNYEQYVNELKNEEIKDCKITKFKITEKIIKRILSLSEDKILLVYQIIKLVSHSKSKDGMSIFSSDKPMSDKVSTFFDEVNSNKEEKENIGTSFDLSQFGYNNGQKCNSTDIIGSFLKLNEQHKGKFKTNGPKFCKKKLYNILGQKKKNQKIVSQKNPDYSFEKVNLIDYSIQSEKKKKSPARSSTHTMEKNSNIENYSKFSLITHNINQTEYDLINKDLMISHIDNQVENQRDEIFIEGNNTVCDIPPETNSKSKKSSEVSMHFAGILNYQNISDKQKIPILEKETFSKCDRIPISSQFQEINSNENANTDLIDIMKEKNKDIRITNNSNCLTTICNTNLAIMENNMDSNIILKGNEIQKFNSWNNSCIGKQRQNFNKISFDKFEFDQNVNMNNGMFNSINSSLNNSNFSNIVRKFDSEEEKNIGENQRKNAMIMNESDYSIIYRNNIPSNNHQNPIINQKINNRNLQYESVNNNLINLNNIKNYKSQFFLEDNPPSSDISDSQKLKVIDKKLSTKVDYFTAIFENSKNLQTKQNTSIQENVGSLSLSRKQNKSNDQNSNLSNALNEKIDEKKAYINQYNKNSDKNFGKNFDTDHDMEILYSLSNQAQSKRSSNSNLSQYNLKQNNFNNFESLNNSDNDSFAFEAKFITNNKQNLIESLIPSKQIPSLNQALLDKKHKSISIYKTGNLNLKKIEDYHAIPDIRNSSKKCYQNNEILKKFNTSDAIKPPKIFLELNEINSTTNIDPMLIVTAEIDKRKNLLNFRNSKTGHNKSNRSTSNDSKDLAGSPTGNLNGNTNSKSNNAPACNNIANNKIYYEENEINSGVAKNLNTLNTKTNVNSIKKSSYKTQIFFPTEIRVNNFNVKHQHSNGEEPNNRKEFDDNLTDNTYYK